MLSDANNTGDRVPKITRGVDWIYIHCDLIAQPVDNIGTDVIYAPATDDLSQLPLIDRAAPPPVAPSEQKPDQRYQRRNNFRT